ncbi:MAG: hypothetical protein ACOC9Y_03050 [Chloroflexota bacterium]
MTAYLPQAPERTRTRQTTSGDRPAPLVHAEPQTRQPSTVPTPVVFIIGVALITVVGMLYLLQTNYVASLGYEMTELQRERERALVENERLQSEIAGITTQREIRATAESDLRMEPMSDYRFVTVSYPDASPPPEEAGQAQAESSLIDRFLNRILGRGEANSTSGQGSGE